MNMQGQFTKDANNTKPIKVSNLNTTKIHEDNVRLLKKYALN